MSRRFEIRFWRKSLVTRLVVSFLLLSWVTVALLGWIGFLQARSSLRAAIFARLRVAADLQADALSQWVHDQQREFHLLAELPSIAPLLSTLCGTEPGDPRHRQAYGSLSEILEVMKARKPAWREVLVLAADSEILFSTEVGHEGDYRILDRFFTEGSSGFYFEKVYPSPITFKPTITFSLPIGSGAEPARGVLAVHLDLERMDEIVFERQGLGSTGASYLVSGLNEMVSGKRFGREDLPRGVSSAGIAAALAGQDGFGSYLDYRDVPVLGVHRWIGDLGVALLTEMPEWEAFAPARELARTTWVAGLLAAIVLAVGMYLLALQIARPVLDITDTAVRVAAGDLRSRAPVATADEVGVLAHTFNAMTERLRSVYENLEREIEERTRIQQERELLITDLETKNAELERFAYTVSHDLKSPLVTIRGFLGFLEKDLASGDSERVRHDIARIDGASQTMRQLLNDLLEMSRIGRLMHPPEEVALGELVREALDMVAGQLAESEFEVVVQPDMPPVYGDRLRLLEVFQNLLSNAVKFARTAPQPRIEIGASGDSDHVLCHVRDNGDGIDPRYHEKIFGLFDQLDGQTEGTGIGLALVKRIVEVHGGRIWVESRPGEGATFFFTLPNASAGAGAARPQ